MPIIEECDAIATKRLRGLRAAIATGEDGCKHFGITTKKVVEAARALL
jgi:hypothetical protein